VTRDTMVLQARVRLMEIAIILLTNDEGIEALAHFHNLPCGVYMISLLYTRVIIPLRSAV
jgi:hypothetical protein